MIKNNLLVALRNFRKHKAITSINMLGLSIGISAALVIFLIIQYEYSFDKWVPERENIYRIYTQMQGGSSPGLCVPGQNAITQGVPGVDIAAPVIIAPFGNKYTVDIADAQTGNLKRFPKNNELSFVDGNYFKIFPRRWIAGNPNTALSQVGQVVLTLSEAQKYFPGNTPETIAGKQITFQDSIQVFVTGIIADIEENTDLRSSIFISLKTYTETNLGKSFMQPAWRNIESNGQLYIKINTSANSVTIDKLVENIFIRNQKDVNPKDRWIGKLQPLNDIHFNTSIDGRASKTTLRNLALLAVLLLLLAVINFINLSTAQSTLRAKEIGVRKTFGGSKKQIIYQFLTEAFLITGLATLLAVILTPVLIYVFKDFIPDELNAGRLLQPVVAVFLTGLLLVVSLLAGIYPAFVLSRFRPVLVLKNNVIANGKPRGIWVRQVLTVSQFVIAQVFLIVVFVIGKQIHFELNKDMGLRKEGIVSLSIPDFMKKRESKGFVLANELRRIPEVQNVSLNTSTPIREGYNSTRIIWYNNGVEETYSDIHVRSADESYIDVFGLQLLAGKNIRVDTSAKVQDVLINESMLHKMNLYNPHDAIGQFIKGGPADSAQIVGIVKDFNTMSLHNPVHPATIFANKNSWIPVLSIALAGNDAAGWKKAIDKTEALFQKMYPDQEFDYSFLDDTVRKLYEADLRLSTLLKWATGLALFISCLGLLGLVSFIANRKIKEMGIRKVLGASAVQIIILLSGNLVRLIAVACVISFPLAWYFSHKWLQNFTFRINISWWIFLISAAGILGVAMLVLCLRSIRAAAANPAKSLRSE